VSEALGDHPLLSLLIAPSRLYPQPPLDLDDLAQAVLALAELGCRFGPDHPEVFTLEELEINPAVASQGRLVALDGVGLVSGRAWLDQRVRPARSARCWNRGARS
jgi:hypothetical protein